MLSMQGSIKKCIYYNNQALKSQTLYINSFYRFKDIPRLHLGPVGSGRDVCKDTKLREEFARLKGLMAVDYESDSVVDSVVGNRTLSWCIVRGTSDYRDGTRKSPWQAHASLAAASVVRALLSSMEPILD